MKVKLFVDVNKVSPQKIAGLIQELESLGVWHNGEVICDESLDTQVSEIMNRYLLKIK